MNRLPDTPLVMLAAGDSSRMGQPKGLLPYRGRPWVIEQLERVGRGGIIDIVLVVGTAADEYRNALRTAEIHGDLEIRLVVNPKPELGKFSSLHAGLRAVERGDAFVLPVDVPCSGAPVFKALDVASTAGIWAAIPTHGNKGGHPTRLSGEFVEELLKLSPADTKNRLDERIHALAPDRVKRVEVSDPQIGINLNSPEEWAKFAAV